MREDYTARGAESGAALPAGPAPYHGPQSQQEQTMPDSSLSFDQDIAIAGARANERSWRGHVDEFRDVRAASLAFFSSVPADGWMRRGILTPNNFM